MKKILHLQKYECLFVYLPSQRKESVHCERYVRGRSNQGEARTRCRWMSLPFEYSPEEAGGLFVELGVDIERFFDRNNILDERSDVKDSSAHEFSDFA